MDGDDEATKRFTYIFQKKKLRKKQYFIGVGNGDVLTQFKDFKSRDVTMKFFFFFSCISQKKQSLNVSVSFFLSIFFSIQAIIFDLFAFSYCVMYVV